MNRGLYRRWVVACTLAELIGIGAAGAAGAALAVTFGEPTTTAARIATLAVFAIAGAVEGAALGLLQWRVLRAPLGRLRAGEWAGVTVAVAVIGWLAGMAGPVLGGGAPADGASQAAPGLPLVLLMAAGLGAGAGALFGAAQWLVLRRHAARAGRWIAIHVPGWAAAMAAIFLGASLPAPGWPVWAIILSGAAGGALGGALLGLITGLVAARLEPWVDERDPVLRGQVAAVTGATSGIGQEVAFGLARLGARVVLLCRDRSRGEATAARIRAAVPHADVRVLLCDLESQASVRAAAVELLRRWPTLDVLVHSAGAIHRRRALTGDGIERTFAVDVAGPFLLDQLLRPRLERCAGRVITLAGIYHRRAHLDVDDLHYRVRPYSWLEASNQAQLARVLLTAELARRAPRLTAVTVHPGAVRTPAMAQAPAILRLLAATLMRPGFVRAELGALPALRLAALPILSGSGGFLDRFERSPTPIDADLARALWRACEAMTRPAIAPLDSGDRLPSIPG